MRVCVCVYRQKKSDTCTVIVIPADMSWSGVIVAVLLVMMVTTPGVEAHEGFFLPDTAYCKLMFGLRDVHG